MLGLLEITPYIDCIIDIIINYSIILTKSFERTLIFFVQGLQNVIVHTNRISLEGIMFKLQLLVLIPTEWLWFQF